MILSQRKAAVWVLAFSALSLAVTSASAPPAKEGESPDRNEAASSTKGEGNDPRSLSCGATERQLGDGQESDEARRYGDVASAETSLRECDNDTAKLRDDEDSGFGSYHEDFEEHDTVENDEEEGEDEEYMDPFDKTPLMYWKPGLSEWELDVWGKPQYIGSGEDEDDVLAVVEATRDYMRNSAFSFQCRNKIVGCSTLAMEGWCENNGIEVDDGILAYDIMIENCSPACQTCDEYLENHYKPDELKYNLDDILLRIYQPESQMIGRGRMLPTLWGVPQNIGAEDDGEAAGKSQRVLDATQEYMIETVLANPDEYGHVLAMCENLHYDCTWWAATGQCDENPAYMHTRCAPACQKCEMLDYRTRCPLDLDAPSFFSKPGDVNALFERIVSDPYWAETYGPLEVISSPATTNGPWVITFDNFVTKEECERFIQLGEDLGYQRSLETSEDESGVFYESEERTSSNTWCPTFCRQDPILSAVHERVETLTGAHYNFFKPYQLLKYEAGQFYDEHIDFTEARLEEQNGPVVLTLFMYLNDVLEGGGTHFSEINDDTVVMPKQGKMVMWPSALDEDPLSADYRTLHAGLPVIRGIKYGATAWVHLRDYRTQWDNSCVSEGPN